MDRLRDVRPSIYEQSEVCERLTKSERLRELAERGRAGNSTGECQVLEGTRIGEWNEPHEDRGFHHRHNRDQEREIENRRETLMVVAGEVINPSVDPRDNVAWARSSADLDGGPRNAAHPDEEENH